MSGSRWEVLETESEAILLGELGALLHDVGKLSSQFIAWKSSTPPECLPEFEHEKAILGILDFVDQRFLEALKSPRFRARLRLRGIDSKEHLAGMLDLIVGHHSSSKDKRFLVKLLKNCDRADSGADKAMIKGWEGKQVLDQTFVATAFGFEPPSQSVDPKKLDEGRGTLTAALGKTLEILSRGGCRISDVQPTTLDLVRSFCSGALGETRRPANDVTLWDHSYSVATLFKSSLAAFLVAGPSAIDQLRWRLLRVNFDMLGLYAKAIKIADLLGYKKRLDEVCQAVKRLVEVKWSVGNEVYRDGTGIYFSFPDLDLPAKIEEEIRRSVVEIEPELAPRIRVGSANAGTAVEQLKKLLGQQRAAARNECAVPVAPENLDPRWVGEWEELGEGRWEVCPVCRLRPMMKEGGECCEQCRKRRQSRVEAWERDPSHTIWMDEVADDNGRVALFVGKFALDDWLSGDLVQTLLVEAVEHKPEECRPKSPSPARLRRIWETAERFWEKAVGDILDRVPHRMRWELVLDRGLHPEVPLRETVCDGALNGQPISVFRIGERLITISHVSQPKGGSLSLSRSEGERKSKRKCPAPLLVARLGEPEADLAGYRRYSPSLILSTSPDQFLAFVPASEAIGVAQEVRKAYNREFGKVQNRLPLFLGLVFFHRKAPLAAVMDTARRMLGGVELTEQIWTVRDVTGEAVKFQNGVTWQVPTMMGDGATKDVWYPYFFVQASPSERRLSFQLKEGKYAGSGKYKDRWLVHVSDLQAGDRVRLTPSRFAYLYLERTAQRFQFDPSKDVTLLDELPLLVAMWKAICRTPEMTDTKLQGIRALFDSKREAWGTGKAADDTLSQLVEATLQRNRISGVSQDDVLSGRFGRCLDLYVNILRSRVRVNEGTKEEELEPESAAL